MGELLKMTFKIRIYVERRLHPIVKSIVDEKTKDEIIGMLNKNLAFIDLGSIVIKSSTIRKVIVKELC